MGGGRPRSSARSTARIFSKETSTPTAADSPTPPSYRAPLNLSSASGLLVQFTTMDFATYGSAPVAITVNLKSSGASCSLVAAFAVATTLSATVGAQWLPLSRPKGNHWQYSSGQTGVPSACVGRPPRWPGSVRSRLECTTGTALSPGPARSRGTEREAAVVASARAGLNLKAAERAASSFRVWVRASALTKWVARGSHVETAALQSAIPVLVAAVSTSWHLEAVERALQLQTAVDAWLAIVAHRPADCFSAADCAARPEADASVRADGDSDTR